MNNPELDRIKFPVSFIGQGEEKGTWYIAAINHKFPSSYFCFIWNLSLEEVGQLMGGN